MIDGQIGFLNRKLGFDKKGKDGVYSVMNSDGINKWNQLGGVKVCARADKNKKKVFRVGLFRREMEPMFNMKGVFLQGSKIEN